MSDPVVLPPMLRIAQAATLLGISRSHCYRLARAGSIPAVRLGAAIRIPRQQLVEWIAAQAGPGRAA
jgi:excisionase family DNA binding protein